MRPKMFVIITLLPIVTGFHVKLLCQIDAEKPNLSLEFKGNEENVITELEKITFGVTDDKIKECIRIYLGHRPEDVFFRSPTPWDDLYNRKRWKQVEKSLVAKRGKIVRIVTEPVIFSRRILENKTPSRANVSIMLTDTADVAFTSTWVDMKKLSMRQNITYEIEIETTGKFFNFAFLSIWGQSGESTQFFKIGSPEHLGVTLSAAQVAQAQLIATRGNMNIEIEYEASLRGNLVVNYDPPYSGHHFWGPRIENVLDTCNVNKTLVFKEIVCLCFYVNPKVIVSDINNGKLIREFKVPMVEVEGIIDVKS